MPKRVERTHAGGTWSKSRYYQFIRSGIRLLTMKWPVKWQVLADGQRKYTGKDKRIKLENTCEMCKKWFPKSSLQLDHITPCGSLKCDDDIVPFLNTALSERENWQRLCSGCHTKKTAKEREDRKNV